MPHGARQAAAGAQLRWVDNFLAPLVTPKAHLAGAFEEHRANQRSGDLKPRLSLTPFESSSHYARSPIELIVLFHSRDDPRVCQKRTDLLLGQRKIATVVNIFVLFKAPLDAPLDALDLRFLRHPPLRR